MARVNTNIRFEAGDAPQVSDDPDYTFFIVQIDDSHGAYLIVDDECWNEAEAFAGCILGGIAARRARKAAGQQASAEEVVNAVPV